MWGLELEGEGRGEVICQSKYVTYIVI